MTDVFAHRGAHLNTRENTLDAFAEARALGVAGVELDVRRSADGTLVVHHDPVADLLVISDTDAGDLPAYVPHLGEALMALRGLKVNVEIKNSRDPSESTYDDSGSFVREVLACVRDVQATSVLISCFDRATCVEVRAQDEGIAVAWLLAEGSLLDSLDVARSARFTGVNPHLSLVTPEGVRRATESGLALNVWTVNSARDLSAMGGLGVASVITDEPALALELLA